MDTTNVYQNKTLMVLGAGVYQVPLIQTAKRLGLYTIVISPPGYPGISWADRWYDCDTTDTQQILAIATECAIDGIVTTGTDVAVPTIGTVCDTLGLPGISAVSALRCSNKVLMKQCLLSSHVSTAPFVVVKNESKLFAAATMIGYPLMTKAIDSSGSRGVYKVHQEDDLLAAWKKSSAVSKNGDVIIETCLQGDEFGAQAIVVGKNVVDIFVHNDQMTEPPFHTPIGHSLPSRFSQPIIDTIHETIVHAIAALGIENAIANVDLMLVDSVPYILEIGARMGATCLPENVSIWTGYDMYACMIDIALGIPIALPLSYAKKPNAALLLQSTNTGVIQSIDIPKYVQDHPNLVRLVIDKHIGDHVKKFEVGPDRIGDIVVKGDDSSTAEVLAQELVNQITIVVG